MGVAHDESFWYPSLEFADSAIIEGDPPHYIIAATKQLHPMHYCWLQNSSTAPQNQAKEKLASTVITPLQNNWRAPCKKRAASTCL